MSEEMLNSPLPRQFQKCQLLWWQPGLDDQSMSFQYEEPSIPWDWGSHLSLLKRRLRFWGGDVHRRKSCHSISLAEQPSHALSSPWKAPHLDSWCSCHILLLSLDLDLYPQWVLQSLTINLRVVLQMFGQHPSKPGMIVRGRRSREDRPVTSGWLILRQCLHWLEFGWRSLFKGYISMSFF